MEERVKSKKGGTTGQLASTAGQFAHSLALLHLGVPVEQDVHAHRDLTKRSTKSQVSTYGARREESYLSCGDRKVLRWQAWEAESHQHEVCTQVVHTDHSLAEQERQVAWVAM